MTSLDWTIVTFYAAAMIGLSLFLARGQKSQADYYVGGRNLPWWAIGLSTMATQTSAISFISIPAFVALKPGGGLTWLQYELAVPLAMIGVAMLLLPFFRQLGLISVYEYLEHRFGPSVRYLLSAVFLLSRALGTGVGLYASGLVLAVILDLELWITILTMGLITLIYDTIGGIRGVIYSDVVQSLILLAGVFIIIGFALEHLDGMDSVFSLIPAQRWQALDPAWGLSGESAAPFWGFLVGGFFLYMSYYGADQSQVQRELSASSVADTRRSLYLNGFARFPLTLGYVIMGLTLGAAFMVSPDLQQSLEGQKYDFLVPAFVLHELPVGIRGLLISALLAASMSSLDSALNSLSAATMRDFVERGRTLAERRILLLSKVTTVFWGLVITGFAFMVGGISDTIIESINKIGSAFYGPILAAFLVGVLSRKATAVGMFAGIISGVAFNLYLWIFLPDVFWMWWNFTGLLVAVAVTFAISLVRIRAGSAGGSTGFRFSVRSGGSNPDGDAQTIRRYTLGGSGLFERGPLWRPAYSLLILYFFLLLGILLFLNYAAENLIPAVG
ncbi:sodium:solute symporter family transporter [Candidatus Thiosymbion oneisti]|uniref:sodium:solute symporter family transporter n=1 Tax=Candidatus Thiosymbion oneisti TaxID=589554 RepID=UPI000A4E8DE1|nr:sodium/solute symporter [Candidatus Thiosymbion oneisti]